MTRLRCPAATRIHTARSLDAPLHVPASHARLTDCHTWLYLAATLGLQLPAACRRFIGPVRTTLRPAPTALAGTFKHVVRHRSRAHLPLPGFAAERCTGLRTRQAERPRRTQPLNALTPRRSVRHAVAPYLVPTTDYNTPVLQFQLDLTHYLCDGGEEHTFVWDTLRLPVYCCPVGFTLDYSSG